MGVSFPEHGGFKVHVWLYHCLNNAKYFGGNFYSDDLLNKTWYYVTDLSLTFYLCTFGEVTGPGLQVGG